MASAAMAITRAARWRPWRQRALLGDGSRGSTGHRSPGGRCTQSTVCTRTGGTLCIEPRPGSSGGRAGVDRHDRVEQAQGVGSLALERVAPNDRAEAPAVPDGAHFLEDLL